MALNNSIHTSHLKLDILKRIIIGSLILLAGMAGMIKLISMRKPPAEAEISERPLHVVVQKAIPKDVPVYITGYGEVRSLNEVSISPEIPGKIVEIHPRLEVGEVISQSELLFKIDESNYKAAQEESRALVSQWENTIVRLEKQYAIDRKRLKTIERNRDLARAEFERIHQLFESNNVGSQSGVDRAEQAFNGASDQADQMAQAVALYPIRIKEAKSSLASAQARLNLANINLRRCAVHAPFNGRIKQASVEKEQYVTPGQAIIILSDDSELEIQVPLDSRDAQKWLCFNADGNNGEIAWFSGLEPVACQIQWTEMRDRLFWQGYLHRVVEFDPQTRTLTVAIRVKAKDAWLKNGAAIPLVDGMFCSVRIPGKTMRQVIALPQQAVSFEGTVYISNANRLKTLPVEVLRADGDIVYIQKGLNPGDLVITTRLVDPMENALLEIENESLERNPENHLEDKRGV